MNRWHFDQQVDLKSGAGDVIWPNALMMEGDNEAHAWQVQVRDGGKAVDMSLYGVTAYFQRADGNTVVVVGSAEGDKATVLLPQSAYAVPGQLLGVMRASMGGSNMTLAACRWTVRNAPDGDYIDPGHVVPSLPELLDRIAEMESATAAANAAAGSVSDAKAAALNAAAEALAAAEDAEAARQAADQAAKAATDATKAAEDAWQALTGDVTQAKNAAEEAAEAANAAAAKATEAAGSVDASKSEAQAAAAEAREAAGSVDDAKGKALAAAGTANAAAQAADEARAGIQGEISALKSDMTAKADKAALTRTDRSLDALWKLNQGISYDFQTDAAAAYAKQVPSGAKLASVEEIGGKTVVWNQKDENNWASYSPAFIPTGIVEKNEREYTYTIDKLGNDLFTNTLTASVSLISGHKYYQSFMFQSDKTCEISIGCVNDNWSIKTYSQENVYIKYNYISIAAAPEKLYIGINKAESSGFVIGDTFSVRDIVIVDLTQLFGSGNEPTDITDSRIAWIEQYAAAHPEYNAGELVSADVESVKYNDAIIADIPASVRALPGYGWSAGSVANAIERTESGWKYVQKVGSVDLGSLNWTRDDRNQNVRTINKSDVKNPSDNAIKIDAICVDYEITSWSNLSITEANCIACSSKSFIGVVDDFIRNSSDMKEIKEHLSGVILYYELAEPIITDITEAMASALDAITVEAGGTLTFENTAKLPVPNIVEYAVKLSEVGA